jgi:hypothetical protein
MKDKLIKIANKLDELGEYDLANEVDELIKNAGKIPKEGTEHYHLANKISDIVYKWIQENPGDPDYAFRTTILALETVLDNVKRTRDREEEAKKTWLKELSEPMTEE